MDLHAIRLEIPTDGNIIVGQSHFIKTVEDIYEAIVNSVPQMKFGIAFNEASGACLTRVDGNDDDLKRIAATNASAVGAGHLFVVALRGGFPINVKNRILETPEVCTIFCATANPVEVIVAQTEQGRGVLGVIDGSSPKGVETSADAEWRHGFLRENRIQEVKVLTALLLILLVAAQDRSDFAKFVRISNQQAAVIESGHVIWRDGKITERAPEEPVIAERLERLAARGRVSLDVTVNFLPGATMRQVLENRADGTPGEEVLDNRAFFDALKPIAGRAPPPDAMKFAAQEHGTLGWFIQEYAGERILWCYGPSLLLVRIPSKNLTLVLSGNLAAARLEDGNVLRSTTALSFLQEVAKLGSPGADNVIDAALDLLHQGQRDGSAKLVREALNRFPELESTPDVTLLYLFAQLRFPETEASATAVIKAHPSLPTAWFYYGQYLENDKRYREAAACFHRIVDHQPLWHHWTVAAAKKELAGLESR